MRPRLLLPLLLAAACTGSNRDRPPAPTDAGADADAGAPRPDAGAACPRIDGEVVSLPTEDGLTLEADLYTTGEAGGPAAVLLHMIPPFHTRANYPAAFIEALSERGITVLNVDRRGAGGDPDLARTAYEGPDGKWDAKAGYDFLTQHPCAVDPERIVFVGASNGTTTAFDFAVYAAETEGVARPAGLVFLTGGGYTENNHAVAEERAVLDALPLQLVFSTEERAWSAALEPGAAPGWAFEEYDPGDHGTRMFAARPESVDAVAGFVASAAGAE